MMRSSRFFHSSLLCFTMLAAQPARAEIDAAVLKQMEQMQAQIAQLQAQMEQLKTQAAAANAKAEKANQEASALKAAALTPAAGASQAASAPQTPQPKITFEPAPKFESADGNYTFKVGGFIQTDAAIYDDDRRDHASGSTFRRARANISGTVTPDWNYRWDVEFANNNSANSFNATIQDMFVQYTGLKPVSFTVGQFKEPFGLEVLNSDLHVTFMERAMIATFAPDRNIGAQVATNGSNWTASLGAFGANAGTVSTNDESLDITSRLTYAPYVDKNERIYTHLGVAGSYREPLTATDSMRFSSRPESNVTTFNIVDTGSITGVDDTRQLGLEAAAVLGPLALQSEYMRADVHRATAPTATFDGFYAEASYFLTGETRNYNPGKGRFDSPKIPQPFSLKEGTWGAWQVAARYSAIDLTDGGVSGGEAKNVTLGLNWYPHEHVRFAANYVRVDTDNTAVVANDDPNVFTVRAQVDF